MAINLKKCVNPEDIPNGLSQATSILRRNGLIIHLYEDDVVTIETNASSLKKLLGPEGGEISLPGVADNVREMLTRDFHGDEPKTTLERLDEATNYLAWLTMQNAIHELLPEK